MTRFTDSPFEKIMVQKPGGRHDHVPPLSRSPECAACPYKKITPCVGYCIRQLKENKKKENDNATNHL